MRAVAAPRDARLAAITILIKNTNALIPRMIFSEFLISFFAESNPDSVNPKIMAR